MYEMMQMKREEKELLSLDTLAEAGAGRRVTVLEDPRAVGLRKMREERA